MTAGYDARGQRHYTNMFLEVLRRLPAGEPHAVPLLFVHGSFTSASIWDERFLPFFARQGYAAYALSLRGHGASHGHDKLAGWRLADYVEDLARAAERLDVPPVLIGHSMGGMVVQKYLERPSHHAGAMVLMASVPPHGLWSSMFCMTLRNPVLMQQLAVTQTWGPRYAWQEVVQRALLSDDIPPSDVDNYFRHFQGESHRVVLDMLGWDRLRLDPARVDMPVLVLGAEHDEFVSDDAIEATAAFYGTEPRQMPTAHAMMLDTRWQQVAAAINDFVASAFALDAGVRARSGTGS
jgi:pimeloyl-ACP methyl ester carboxylesterase